MANAPEYACPDCEVSPGYDIVFCRLHQAAGDMAAALAALADRYNARGPFISCITPPHRGPGATKADNEAAAKSPHWAEWDAAVAALRKAGIYPAGKD
jgi:hypothetical protein